MAGKIIADIIEAPYDKVSLNVGNVTVASINASGVYSNTGNLLINNSGSIGSASIAANAVTQVKIASGVAGTGPAFSVHSSTGQTISTATATKITFGTEVFDTNNNFTNSRFTPTVAGYYQITATGTLGGSDTGVAIIIYKNGDEESRSWSVPISGVFNAVAVACKIVYLNGTTDFIEAYAYQGSGTNKTLNSGISSTNMSGALVRAA